MYKQIFNPSTKQIFKRSAENVKALPPTNSFILFNYVICIRVALDLEPILGIQFTRWEFAMEENTGRHSHFHSHLEAGGHRPSHVLECFFEYLTKIHMDTGK